jgi:hypothetical protein
LLRDAARVPASKPSTSPRNPELLFAVIGSD